jgi:hypothetical protein
MTTNQSPRIPDGTRVIVTHELGEEEATVYSGRTFPQPVGGNVHQYDIQFDDGTLSMWGSNFVRVANAR